MAENATCPNPAATSVPGSTGTGLLRIGRMLAAVLLIFGSLLAFPSVVPWMIAIWLLLFTVWLWRERPAWIILLLALVILLVKRVDWPPWMVFFLVVGGLAVATSVASSGLKASRRRKAFAAVAVCVWAAWGLMAWDWQRTAGYSGPPRHLAPQRPVVCLGDSLTAGGYPAELARRLGAPVIDWGRDGITSRDARLRIEQDRLFDLQPQALVLSIGGHDYNQGRPRHELQENLEWIIERCLEADVAVVLVEIPRGFVTDPFGGIERQMARRYGLPLVPDTPIRRFVLFSPVCPPGMWLPETYHLSHDGLHPNSKGNALFAQYVQRGLEQVFGPQ